MAGSVATLVNREGYLYGCANRPVGIVRQVTADATDASLPTVTIEGVSGLLVGADIEFDETTTPDSITLTPKTIGGIALKTATTLTASGRILLSPPVPFAGGLVWDPVGENNSVNAAQFKIVSLVI